MILASNSPPKLGGVPARTAKREPDRAKPQEKSEAGGVVPKGTSRLASLASPPNLGGELVSIFAIVPLSQARGEHAPAPSLVCKRLTHAGPQSVPIHPRQRLPLWKTPAATETH